MIVLGIESSCDETAVALVGDNRQIYSHYVHSQASRHNEYGGVVPELAARQHMLHITEVLTKSVEASGFSLTEIDALAVTSGPGLIGSLIVGIMIAKSIATVLNKPCIEINHLEGHALTPRLVYDDLDFPYLLLLISGGHCQILIAEGIGQYHLLGQTKDDSPGEAFDKVAKMLDLGYPGGPAIEKIALKGNPKAINFPKPLYKQKNCDFSFSGLKTAVSRYLTNNFQQNPIRNHDIADIAASFQETIAEILADRLRQSIPQARQDFTLSRVVVSGGVASNQYIRKKLENIGLQYDLSLMFPPPDLCTDNGAMIAWAGIERLKISQVSDITFAPKSTWPLFKM